jgi:hypothetical protein
MTKTKKGKDKKDRATPKCRPIRLGVFRLEEDASAYLDDALTAAATGNLRNRRAV